ncbi:hypothetical protein HDU93_003924 [Gonapodya sp. JEL0774]|nr:hypothetical protein HDU93_003924 [Gonapodya sp. JEL0774]
MDNSSDPLATTASTAKTQSTLTLADDMALLSLGLGDGTGNGMGKASGNGAGSWDAHPGGEDADMDADVDSDLDLPRNKILVVSSSHPSAVHLPVHLIRDILHTTTPSLLPHLDTLLSSSDSPSSPTSTSPSPSSALANGAIVPWSVENKYYRAELDFWVAAVEGHVGGAGAGVAAVPAGAGTDGAAECEGGGATAARPDTQGGTGLSITPPAPDSTSPSEPAHTTFASPTSPTSPHSPSSPFLLTPQDWDLIGPMVDAVVVVFDPANPSTLKHLTPHTTTLSKFSPSISICVAYDPAGSLHSGPVPDPISTGSGSRHAPVQGHEKRRAALHESYRDWCAERGFEYVVVDPSTGVLGGGGGDGEDGEEEDEDEELGREREGVPRIVEALVSHVWDGAEPAGSGGGSEPGVRATGAGGVGRRKARDGDEQGDDDGFGEFESVVRAMVEIDPGLAAHTPSRSSVRAMHLDIFGPTLPRSSSSSATLVGDGHVNADANPAWVAAFEGMEPVRSGDKFERDGGSDRLEEVDVDADGFDDDFGAFAGFGGGGVAAGGFDLGLGEEGDPEEVFEGFDRAFEKLRGLRGEDGVPRGWGMVERY